MRRQTRGPTPRILAENWQQWGLDWEEQRASQPSKRWSWRTVNGCKVNETLIPLLRDKSDAHCSFCDAFPVSPPSNETIEHFRPKSQFPRLAWQWENLFYCCDFCQSRKKEKWDEDLLRPDGPDYGFASYFWADNTNGRIEVLPRLPEPLRRQAEATLLIYDLNHPRHCAQRLRALEFRSALLNRCIDIFPYRDFLLAGEKADDRH